MIRTGEQYRESIRDGREVWINGERVDDVTEPPRVQADRSTSARASTTWRTSAATARRHDLSRRTASATPSACKLPKTQEDWQDKRRGGRRGDGGHRRRRHPRRRRDGRRDVVAVRRPGRAQRGRSAFSDNIERHIDKVIKRDPFHVSANTDPKGDRSKRAAGPGPGHAAACGQGDRCRHRRARRQVRDRGGLCQPGLRQADHRQLGRREAVGLRARLHRATWARRA